MVKVVTAVEVIDDISHNWLFCREIYALLGVLFTGLKSEREERRETSAGNAF